MFLVKYAISVKREEMRKLEKLARDEEQKLVIAEQCLEDDAVTFDLFLKENDKSSVEAIRQAEVEMRKKLDKGITWVLKFYSLLKCSVAEVKRLSNIIRGIQTEISKQATITKNVFFLFVFSYFRAFYFCIFFKNFPFL